MTSVQVRVALKRIRKQVLFVGLAMVELTSAGLRLSPLSLRGVDESDGYGARYSIFPQCVSYRFTRNRVPVSLTCIYLLYEICLSTLLYSTRMIRHQRARVHAKNPTAELFPTPRLVMAEPNVKIVHDGVVPPMCVGEAATNTVYPRRLNQPIVRKKQAQILCLTVRLSRH